MSMSLQEILDHAEELADHFEANPPDPADTVDATTLHALRDAVVDRAKAKEAVATADRQVWLRRLKRPTSAATRAL